MFKFTPGPWRLTTNKHRNTDGTPWGCVDATLHPAGGAGYAPAGTTIRWRGARGRANAALIAAAPDLYAALEKALAFVESEAEARGEQDRFYDHPAVPVAFELRAALAKARGEG